MLLDMLLAIAPDARVFALDTHVLFPETYDVWRQVEKRYGIQVEVYQGPRSAARRRSTATRSGSATRRSAARSARSARSATRSPGSTAGSRACAASSPPPGPAPSKLGWDERHELWQANPLADWTEAAVDAYIEERELPVNALHSRGYASIGCTHCTEPGAGREGRWTGNDKTECGLHVDA